MSAFEKLRESSEAIIAICEKKQHTKEDKKQLMNIHKQIFASIESLMECEGCDKISDLIATIAIDGVSANLCKDCGIKSLEAGKVVKKRTSYRRRKPAAGKAQKVEEPKTAENADKTEVSAPKTSSAKSQKSSSDKSKSPKEKTKPDLADVYEKVEAETGIKKADVKRIDKLIKEIALPMDLEKTIIYINAELEKAKMRVEPSAAEKAVSILMAVHEVTAERSEQ